MVLKKAIEAVLFVLILKPKIVCMLLCGIDYGSKMAGTTVLFFWQSESKSMWFYASQKKEDADLFLEKYIRLHTPDSIFIDAPLSLPKVYQNPFPNSPKPSSNYFFRACDQALSAMSPMFLGGLTARAMQLKAQLSLYPFYETYPAQQAKRMKLDELNYKQNLSFIPQVLTEIKRQYPDFQDITLLNTWHQIDALLALIAAYRFWKGEVTVFGDLGEGLIYV